MSKTSLSYASPVSLEKQHQFLGYPSGERSDRRIRQSKYDQVSRSRGILRALVVDDCASNRLLYCHFLRTLGYSIRSCENAEKAIEICKKRAFDLILMDISLPGMNGIQATKQIYADADMSDKARIVFCTGYSNCDIQLPDSESSLLLKPFTRKKLSEHLSSLKIRKVL